MLHERWSVEGVEADSPRVPYCFSCSIAARLLAVANRFCPEVVPKIRALLQRVVAAAYGVPGALSTRNVCAGNVSRFFPEADRSGTGSRMIGSVRARQASSWPAPQKLLIFLE